MRIILGGGVLYEIPVIEMGGGGVMNCSPQPPYTSPPPAGV